MLTTMSQSSSSANAGSVMPSWHYGGGNGMAIPGTSAATSNSMCGGVGIPNNASNNVSASMSVGNNTNRLVTMSSGSAASSSAASSAASSLGAVGAINVNVGNVGGVSSDLLTLNRQVKLEYSPTGNMYGNSSTPDLEPEFRARANTWHAERKRPDRQMLESLLEEDDDSPEDSLDAKPESLSPLDSSMMGGSPLSASASGPNANKKISRRNAWGNLSYADLITKAIECSPEKRLTLSQIYDWMVQNIPYFKDKGDTTSSAGWKNSIRHNLSLHTRFMRVQNESSGKSSWWVINPDASKSGKSPRRRAASIDTKNFERKRGRVKKRLSALTGSTSTDFGSALGSRNLSTSSINTATSGANDGVVASSSSTSHHDYRPLHFSTTASLESRLQHLASNDPCWSDAPSSSLGTGGSGSVGAGFDMDLDSPVGPAGGKPDSYHHQMFGAPQAGARSNPTYGNIQQQQNQAAGAASTPPHLTTTYLQLQGSYHLAAVANTPNHHHHGSPGSGAAPAAMGTFHAFHSSPFGQHPTAAASYNMPSYHIQQSMPSYNNGNGSNAMTHGGDHMQQQNGGNMLGSPQIKSYSSLQPVTMNQYPKQPQQAPQMVGGSNYGPSGSNANGLVGTVHHHHHAGSGGHQQPQQQSQQSHLNQQQQLLGLGAGNNSAGMNSTSASGLPQDLDFFEPFGSSGMGGGSGGLLGLNGGSSVGPGNSAYFVDIADMDSTIGKDLCADSSLDVNLEFESLLSSSQMS